MTDSDKFPFGKTHKGKQMIDVPADYLLWLRDEGSAGVRRFYPEVFEYIKDNEDVLESQVNRQNL